VCTRAASQCVRVCACVCVLLRGLRLSTGNDPVSTRRLSPTASNREDFIVFLQYITRRKGRGLCFDRVTAAGGAEFVVVSGACAVLQIQLTLTGLLTLPLDSV